MKLKRHRRNPIIEPRGDDWEALATFNPAAIKKDGKIYVFYRAVGDYFNYASSLGLAIFDEELNLVERKQEPVFGPDLKLWELSVEDPRITEIEGVYYMTYVTTCTPAPPFGVRMKVGLPKPEQAFSRCAVAVSKDLDSFRRLGILTPYDAEERNLVLFPRRIDGKILALHRPANWVGGDYGTDRPSIWLSFLDELPGIMKEHKLVLSPEEKWEENKIGAGPPPVETEKGWLLIYHGVDDKNVYRVGAALLDLEKPWKVVAKTSKPILEPEKEYEKEGDVPNVVFPTGAVVVGDELLVFYGAADKVCCVASANLNDVLDYLVP